MQKLTDDEMIELAKQDRPISRDELGIQTPSTSDGLQILNEGFDFSLPRISKKEKLFRWLIKIDSEPILGYGIGFVSGFIIMAIALLAIIIGVIL